MKEINHKRLDSIVDEARHNADARSQGYRERALKIYPWICGRCGREFSRSNLAQLTVHHRDHNHDNNPPDGSNWELLCIYCHDNEHQRQIEAQQGNTDTSYRVKRATHSPFADLKEKLSKNQEAVGLERSSRAEWESEDRCGRF